MFDDLKEAIELFETHVPFSDASFLILKAHLVIEVHLLSFIKARTSPEVFESIAHRDTDFRTRVLFARALAERDEIAPIHAEILWPALALLGNLRNDVAHLLEHKGSSLQDKMRSFVERVDPTNELFPKPLSARDLHRDFRDAALHLCSLLVINHEPLLIRNEVDSEG